MRKYIVGFIVGVLLASSIPAFAAVQSLVGKKVDREVLITLDKEVVGHAVVIEGRSYIPVRAMSNALELQLDVQKEVINITSPEPPSTYAEHLRNQIEEHRAKIATNQEKISSYQIIIEDMADTHPARNDYILTVEGLEVAQIDLQESIAIKEAELLELESRK